MSKPGHNSELSPEEEAEIAKRTRAIQKLEEKRRQIGAEITAERKAIRAMAIDLDAWRASKRRAEMDPDQRVEFDRCQSAVNKALGVPLQADFFGANDGGPTEIPDAA